MALLVPSLNFLLCNRWDLMFCVLRFLTVAPRRLCFILQERRCALKFDDLISFQPLKALSWSSCDSKRLRSVGLPGEGTPWVLEQVRHVGVTSFDHHSKVREEITSHRGCFSDRSNPYPSCSSSITRCNSTFGLGWKRAWPYYRLLSTGYRLQRTARFYGDRTPLFLIPSSKMWPLHPPESQRWFIAIHRYDPLLGVVCNWYILVYKISFENRALLCFLKKFQHSSEALH